MFLPVLGAGRGDGPPQPSSSLQRIPLISPGRWPVIRPIRYRARGARASAAVAFQRARISSAS